MKKTLSLLLALSFVLGYFQFPAAAETETGVWYQEPFLDEFGDPMEDRFHYTVQTTGTYSNNEVDDGLLNVTMILYPLTAEITLRDQAGVAVKNPGDADVHYVVSLKDSDNNVTHYDGYMRSHTSSITLPSSSAVRFIATLLGSGEVKFAITELGNVLNHYNFVIPQDPREDGIGTLLEELYAKAGTYMQNRDYSRAAVMYERLGRYKNSAALAAEAKHLGEGTPCTELKISEITDFFVVGQNWKIKAEASPADTTDVITYASDNEAVATVSDEGLIVTFAPGIAQITVTCGACELKFEIVVRERPEETEKVKSILNVLVIGLDRDEGSNTQLADTMMLFTLNMMDNTLNITSFLRDSYVDMPDFYRGHALGWNRLNMAYPLGKAFYGDEGALELTNLALEENYGIPIDGDIVFEFEAFEEVIDLLGGIELELTEAEADQMNIFVANILANYPDEADKMHQFCAGVNFFTGREALNFARMRRSSPSDSDISRTGRQRMIVETVAAKLVTMNPIEVAKIAALVLPSLKTNIPADRMTSYMQDLLVWLPHVEITSNQCPAEGTYWGELVELTDGLTGVLKQDFAPNKAMLKKICDPNPTEQPETISVTQEKAIFGALEAYAGFMINAPGSRADLDRYFDSRSKIYSDLLHMGNDLWMNYDNGHKFLNETILRYDKTVELEFTVRASLVMRAKMRDLTERDFPVEVTMQFWKMDGKWYCVDLTNADGKIGSDAAPVNWDAHPDGIAIQDYRGETFNAHVMLIRDPSRIYLGLSNYDGFSTDVPGKRMNEAVADEKAAAAINAGSFNDDGTASSSVGSIPAGLTIYDGAVVSDVYKDMFLEKGFCGFNADNRLVVAESLTASKAIDLGIRYGCEIGPALIIDGEASQKVMSMSSGYAPRSAIGQLEDGTVIFVCADGRQAGSLGATYRDMVTLLKAYGAVNACSMMGGSSSVMMYRDTEGLYGTPGEVVMVNSYSALQSLPRRMPAFWMVKAN